MTAPLFETIDEAEVIKIPPWLVLSESDQIVTGPPAVCKALLINTFALALRTSGAVVLVLAVMLAPVSTLPPVASMLIPPLPTDVIAPVPP